MYTYIHIYPYIWFSLLNYWPTPLLSSIGCGYGGDDSEEEEEDEEDEVRMCHTNEYMSPIQISRWHQ